MPRSPVDLPHDEALGTRSLTDPAAVAELLRETTHAPLGPGRIRYIEHVVGRSLLVQYRFELPAEVPSDQRAEVPAEQRAKHCDVVVSIGRRTWLDGAVPMPSSGRGPAGVHRPAADVDGVCVSWYPFDPGMPMLARELGALIGPGPVERLAWVPQQRAVLAAGEHVVKLDADPARVAMGVSTLDRIRPFIAVPDVVAVDESANAFVQRRLPGRPLDRDDAWPVARSAGELARTLSEVPGEGLARLGPRELVDGLGRVVALVVHAAPELGVRVAAAVDALRSTMPEIGEVVTAHGDFNVGQLIALGTGPLALVDTDTLCAAAPALDLASYATNVLGGRDGDLGHCARVVDALVEGYGAAPPGLDWYLAATAMRRLDRSIRRYKRSWRRRVEMHLVDVETLIASLGTDR